MHREHPLSAHGPLFSTTQVTNGDIEPSQQPRYEVLFFLPPHRYGHRGRGNCPAAGRSPGGWVSGQSPPSALSSERLMLLIRILSDSGMLLDGSVTPDQS